MKGDTKGIRLSGCCQGRNKLPGGASAFACFATAPQISTSAPTSDDYDYTVMARTGQDGLAGITFAPSINNHGEATFSSNLTQETSRTEPLAVALPLGYWPKNLS
jgi:hypothetical protein